jgi:hypothetical protein
LDRDAGVPEPIGVAMNIEIPTVLETIEKVSLVSRISLLDKHPSVVTSSDSNIGPTSITCEVQRPIGVLGLDVPKHVMMHDAPP